MVLFKPMEAWMNSFTLDLCIDLYRLMQLLELQLKVFYVSN